jgi:hypothetical protein
MISRLVSPERGGAHHVTAGLVACGGSPGIADSRDVVNTWLALLDVFGSDESKRTQRAAKLQNYKYLRRAHTHHMT